MWRLPQLCNWLCERPLCKGNTREESDADWAIVVHWWRTIMSLNTSGFRGGTLYFSHNRIADYSGIVRETCACDSPFQSLLSEPVPFGESLHSDLLFVDRGLLRDFYLWTSQSAACLWVVHLCCHLFPLCYLGDLTFDSPAEWNSTLSDLTFLHICSSKSYCSDWIRASLCLNNQHASYYDPTLGTASDGGSARTNDTKSGQPADGINRPLDLFFFY